MARMTQPAVPEGPDVAAAAVACARRAEAGKARDIECFDVSAHLVVTQLFLCATGDSGPQLRALADACEVECEAAGLRRRGREVDAEATWILLDYGDLVIHLFRPETRAYYALESLWADAPRLDWQGDGKARLPRLRKRTPRPPAEPKPRKKPKAAAKAKSKKPGPPPAKPGKKRKKDDSEE